VSKTAGARDDRCLVELIGPAGAGKSSLLRALRQRDARICGNVEISCLTYLRDIPPLLATFAKFHRPFRGLRQKEMKRVLHLTTLGRVLRAPEAEGPHIQVLDEGPVYMLTRMLCLGEPRFDNEAFHLWWDVAVSQWARRLRLVVCLDAAPYVLARRIRRRPGPPPISDTTDGSLLPFLEKYRRCYDRVVHQLTEAGGPAPVTFDTSCLTIDSLANHVLGAIRATGE
jgi:hypothetical protein